MTLTELIAELTDQLAHHGGDVRVVASRDLGFTDVAGVDDARIDATRYRHDDEDLDTSETVVVVQTG